MHQKINKNFVTFKKFPKNSFIRTSGAINSILANLKCKFIEDLNQRLII